MIIKESWILSYRLFLTMYEGLEGRRMQSWFLWCHMRWVRSYFSHPKWTSGGTSKRDMGGGRWEEMKSEREGFLCQLFSHCSISQLFCLSRHMCICMTAWVSVRMVIPLQSNRICSSTGMSVWFFKKCLSSPRKRVHFCMCVHVCDWKCSSR